MNYKTVGIGAGVVLGSYLVIRFLDTHTSSSGSAVAPTADPTIAPPGVTGEQPIRILPGPLVMLQGHTYFAVLEANGTVSAAANPDRVKAKAEELGFRDVAVFTERPPFFPGVTKGDYYVRGTYTLADQKTLPPKTSVFLGSVVVLDAFVAPL